MSRMSARPVAHGPTVYLLAELTFHLGHVFAAGLAADDNGTRGRYVKGFATCNVPCPAVSDLELTGLHG